MKAMLSIVMALLALASASAQACSCRDVPQTVQEHIAQNDVIFLGRAIGSRPVLDFTDGFAVLHSTKFPITSALKGVENGLPNSASRYVYVRHDRSEGNGANCGVTFVEGEDYRIFATPYKGKNYTSECNYSTYWDHLANQPWEEYERAAKSEGQ